MPQINPEYSVPPVQRRQASRYAGAVSSAAQGRSSVEVSATARELSEALALAQKAPEVNTDRVEQLRARIESGEYRVDLEGLAGFLAERL